MKPRKIKFAVLSVSIITIVLALLFSAQNDDQAPKVTFNIIDGSKIHSSDLANKPLLVTFWATTCSVCIEEMPELIDIYDAYRPKGLEMVGVAIYYDPPNKVMEFVTTNNLPYPIALDFDKTLSKAFNNVETTPTTFLISANGNIIKRYDGRLPFDKLEKQIEQMLNQNLTSNTELSKNLG